MPTTKRLPHVHSAPREDRRGASDSSPSSVVQRNGSRRSDPHPPRSDETDLDALQQRETWAVRRWIYGERKYVRCVLAQHGVDDDELADLVQEVFYQAIRSLPSFQGNAKITTWLYSIARNVAYSHQRKSKPHSSLTPEMMSRIQSEQSSSRSLSITLNGPREDTIRRERSALIRDALSELPPHYAQIIRLRDLEEHTTSETAETLGITEVNARVRLHRARKALRERLTRYF